jgi:hypothetical protein
MKAAEAGHDAGYYDYRKDERASASQAGAYSSNPWGDLGGPTQVQAAGATYAGVTKAKSPSDPMVAAKGGGSVYDWVLEQFKQYGMGDVGKAALEAIQGSHNEVEAVTAIRNSDAYKTRFAGNIARVQSGKGALSEGEYLSMENSYRQSMRAAGLPKGFYDQPNDLAKFIAGDVSVAEVAQRAKTAMDLVNTKDPETLKAFKDFYGVDKGHLAAYYLDSNRAMPLLEKAAEAAKIGAEAIRNGIATSGTFAESLVDKGVTQGQARQAYDETAVDRSTLAKLASIDGTKVGLNDVVEAKLGLDSKMEGKLRGITGRERSRFSGKSGGTAALGTSSSGSF